MSNVWNGPVVKLCPEGRMAVILLPDGLYGIFDSRIKPGGIETDGMGVCLHDTLEQTLACLSAYEVMHREFDDLDVPDDADRYVGMAHYPADPET